MSLLNPCRNCSKGFHEYCAVPAACDCDDCLKMEMEYCEDMIYLARTNDLNFDNGGETKITRLKHEEPEKQDYPLTMGIGKVAGQSLTIKGYKKFMAKPTDRTSPEKITKNPETGQNETEYKVIETLEKFDINGEKVNNFFLTDATARQLENENVIECIQKKDYLIVEPYMYQGKKNSYWYFRNPTPKDSQETLN